ncbi:MAG: hypothetical protein ACOWWR_06155 [Eubacteriales bacterium]
MKITLAQVEALRKRVDCDYQLAEKALRKSRGNTDDAVLYLKKRENKKTHKMFAELEEIFYRLLSYHLVIEKGDKTIFSFPIFLMIIFVWMLRLSIPVLIVIGILAAFSNLSFEIIDKKTGNIQEFKLNKKKTKEDINTKPTDVKKDVHEKMIMDEKAYKVKESISIGTQKEQKTYKDVEDDDFNEITIE